MKFQFSAGGIVFKKENGKTFVLVSQHSQHHGWVFPKGLIGDHIEGESKESTAIREVEEETGILAKILRPLSPVNYWYVWNKEKIKKSVKPYVIFFDSTIELGTEKTDDPETVRRLLYKGYKNEAITHFPILMRKVLSEHENEKFKPEGLIIRTMKRRWGSCSNKGIVTLSTELIKLSDQYIEYVITHELCHLKHHNHGPNFYKLLTEIYPEWKTVRRELRKYIQ